MQGLYHRCVRCVGNPTYDGSVQVAGSRHVNIEPMLLFYETKVSEVPRRRLIANYIPKVLLMSNKNSFVVLVFEKVSVSLIVLGVVRANGLV